MAFVAIKRLRWGNGWLDPGQPVPEGEAGRSYQSLLRHGHIVNVADAGDDQIRAALEAVTAERDELAARVAELEAQPAEASANDDDRPASDDGNDDEGGDLPGGWTQTSPGWFEGPDGQKVHGRKALDEALNS